MESEGPSVRVGYNKVFGGLLLGLGILCLVLGFLAHLNMSMLVGAVNGLIGFLYLVKPYFVLTPRAIELKNLFGMTMRRYDFEDLGKLEVSDDGRSIFQVEPSGEKKRVKLSRWIADGNDWRRFLGLVQARAFE